MKNEWFVIINPTSGNGKAKKYWNEIYNELKNQHIQFSFVFTEYHSHENELVKNAIKNGFYKIISVGGDGTLHHIVNGIMKQKTINPNKIQLAVIPIGTGNDWVKTYNIPANIKKSISIIKKGFYIQQDIGKIVTDTNSVIYFNNVAGIGYDGYVANKLKKLKKFGSISYLLGGLQGLLFYKNLNFKIEVNNQILTNKCLMIAFGICKFSGGGMQFTENVNPIDGLLDITIIKNLKLFNILLNLPKLYTGKIVDHKKVLTLKSSTLKITNITSNKPIYLQADGEVTTSKSITIYVLKNSIQFIVPKF